MPIVTMSGLGREGQWGNQVIQYAFIRTFAKRHGCEYGVPPWAGQFLFGRSDPHVSVQLPHFRERYEPTKHEAIFGIPIPPTGAELIGRNFIGYAQYHTSWYAPDREFILSLYDTIAPEQTRVERLLSLIRERGKTIVAIHIRRSDSGRMIWHLTPITWYLRWLRDNWERLDEPVLYVATEDPSLKRYFVKWNPLMMEDLGVEAQGKPPAYHYPYGNRFHHLRQLDFFPDWYVMQHADVLVGSDSTFSFSAAWISRCVREYWRSRLSTQRFEMIDPWDCHVSWREHLNDYPDIPGTQADSNPLYGDHWRNFTATHPSVPEDPKEIEALMR